jgi:hypothetical protein
VQPASGGREANAGNTKCQRKEVKRRQPDDACAQKCRRGESLIEAVLVGVRQNEAAEVEEKIHGEVTVLRQKAKEQAVVKDDNHDRSDSAKSIECLEFVSVRRNLLSSDRHEGCSNLEMGHKRNGSKVT